ncbi:unnamed protein product [Arctogadus glacialis]
MPTEDRKCSWMFTSTSQQGAPELLLLLWVCCCKHCLRQYQTVSVDGGHRIRTACRLIPEKRHGAENADPHLWTPTPGPQGQPSGTMGNCLSEMKRTKGGLLKNLPETDDGKTPEITLMGEAGRIAHESGIFIWQEEERGPPSDGLYAAVDYRKKRRSSGAPGPHDSSARPSECVYSVIIPHRPPAPPTSEAEDGADDYVLMQ